MVPRISAISSGDWGLDSFSQVSTTPTQPVDDEGAEIFIVGIGLRTFQNLEGALFQSDLSDD